MSDNDTPQYDPFAVPEGYDPNAAEQAEQQLEQNFPPKEPWYKKNPAMMNFVALTIAIIAAGLFVYLPHYLHRSNGADYPTIGYPAPAFEAIEPLSDNPDLKPFGSYNLPGKTTLLNIWGPWCGPCRQELPHMSALNKKLSKNPNFQYISVAYPQDLVVGFEAEKSVDGRYMKINPNIKEQKELFQRIALDTAVTAGFSGKEIYWDPEGNLINALYQSLPSEKQYLGVAFPTTILFDDQKIIRAVWVGYKPGMEKQIEEKTQALLNPPEKKSEDK